MNVMVMVIEMVKVKVIEMNVMVMVIEMVKVKVMMTTCSIEAGKPGRPIED